MEQVGVAVLYVKLRADSTLPAAVVMATVKALLATWPRGVTAISFDDETTWNEADRPSIATDVVDRR
jgi:hypothetical protein